MPSEQPPGGGFVDVVCRLRGVLGAAAGVAQRDIRAAEHRVPARLVGRVGAMTACRVGSDGVVHHLAHATTIRTDASGIIGPWAPVPGTFGVYLRPSPGCRLVPGRTPPSSYGWPAPSARWCSAFSAAWRPAWTNHPIMADTNTTAPSAISTTLNFSPMRNTTAPGAMMIGHHDEPNRWPGPTSALASGSFSARSYGPACSSTVAMYSSATENTPSITAPASSFATSPYTMAAVTARPASTMKLLPADRIATSAGRASRTGRATRRRRSA